MSSFKVYKGGTGTRAAHFEGMQLAAERFHALYPANSGKPKEFFENLIYDLVIGSTSQTPVSVTYAETGVEYPVKAVKKNNKVKLSFEVNGQDRTLDVDALKDDDSGNRKVNMVIPADNVDFNDQYLQEAVEDISTRGTAEQKRKFLLGMILLTRCR